MNPHMSKPSLDRSINVPDDLLRKLLTDSEWRMVKQRLMILNLLEEGLSIRKIAEKVKVGTDTVVRVARLAEKKNLRTNSSSSKLRKIKSSTPWIFGKSD